MAGLPKKYAKLGFAKGWRAFKASKRRTGSKKRTTTKKRRAPVAVKRKRRRGAAVRAGARRAYRRGRSYARRAYSRARRSPALARGTREVLQTMTTAGSVLAANAITNYTPGLKDLTGRQKAAGQGAIGLGVLLFTRNPWLKFAGGGLMLAGAFNFIREVPELNQLLGQGDRATLTPHEMAELTRQASMGVPAAVTSGRGMGVMSTYMNRRVSGGVPATVVGDWGSSWDSPV